MGKKKKRRKPQTTATPSSSSPSTPVEPTAASGDVEVSHRPSPSAGGTKISKYVSFGLLLGTIALLSILFYEVMAQFLVPLFLAALLVVIFRPLHRWMLDKTGGREKVSALLTTGSVLLVVLIPIAVLFTMAAAEARQVIRYFNANQIIQSVQQLRTRLNLDLPAPDQIHLIEKELSAPQTASLTTIEFAAEEIAVDQDLAWPVEPLESTDDQGATAWLRFAGALAQIRDDLVQIKDSDDASRADAIGAYERQLFELSVLFSDFKSELLHGEARAKLIGLVNPTDQDIEFYVNSVVDYSRAKLLKFGGAGVSWLASLGLGTAIMIIGLYFFLLDGPNMIESFKRLSPMDDEHEQELVEEFSRVSRAVVVATLLSALVQGLLAGVGFYFAGLESIFLLTVLSAVLAMVPFVGAAAVWVPCCLYLYFIENNLTAAIGLAVYGTAVISMADNLIKPLILHGQSNLHPLLALLSVLGGVGTLGPIGILVGPMVVVFLQTLLKILQREMIEIDQQPS